MTVYLDKDAAILKAAGLHYDEPPIDDTDLVTISTRTLRALSFTKFMAVANRPGRGGYPDDVKHFVLQDWLTGKYTISKLARMHTLDRQTVQRWINDNEQDLANLPTQGEPHE